MRKNNQKNYVYELRNENNSGGENTRQEIEEREGGDEQRNARDRESQKRKESKERNS